MRHALILITSLFFASNARAVLASNLHPTYHHAWSQNAGWLNLSPFGWTDDGVQVTSFTMSGIAWGQNVGWMKFGDGTPEDGLRYSNASNSSTDYGVNLDWRGNLSGYAWSQNAGWINFQWTSTEQTDRPTFNFTTQKFSGYAWSASLGWINLGGDWLRTDGPVGYYDQDQDGIPDTWEVRQVNKLTIFNATTDSDGDGMPDGWEFTHFRSLAESNGTQDSDGDGFTDAVEYAANTSPTNPASPGAYPTPSTTSTISENDPYAWGQNLGWINARHNQPNGNNGVFVTSYQLRGTAWAQNAGWINFGDGTPRDGLRYTNTTADDCGVNLDCDFNLSGYAWGQNIGWINFGWASSSDPNRPRINKPSNFLAGYAWAQNAGWINLSTMNVNLIANMTDIDSDGLPDQWEFNRVIDIALLDNTADTDRDGLRDAWEFANFRSLTVTNGNGDFDQDGVSDANEFIASTNPRDVLSLPPPGNSSIASGGSFAWAQNAGWISLRHDQPRAPAGALVREYFLEGQGWGQNIGWLDFGDGTPTNGIRYSNTTSNDCGVNHDGAGNLSGYAWSQNAGWINFGWAAANHPDRARVSLVDGSAQGYAWGQNIGWINLGTGLQTLAISMVDSDNDGLDDAWEREKFGNLTATNGSGDNDHDGQTDLEEFNSGTSPMNPNDRFQILSESFNGNHTIATLTFSSSSTRTYSAQTSNDLIHWTAAAQGFAPGDPQTTTVSVPCGPATNPRCFFLIQSKRPLTP